MSGSDKMLLLVAALLLILVGMALAGGLKNTNRKTAGPGRREQPKRTSQKAARRRMGNTDRLGYILVFILALGLAGGFYLARMSIQYQYTGALACYTVVFTPIGTALSIVLSRIVEKNRAENTGPNGEGVKYSAAEAAGFVEDISSEDSPAI